jgi:hypothetical protein
MEGRVKERIQVTVEEFHSYIHENNYFLVFWHLAEGLVTKRARICRCFTETLFRKKNHRKNNSLLKTMIDRHLKIKRGKIKRVLLYWRFCRT